MTVDAPRPPVGPTLVFVDDLHAPVLDDADAHHLGRVLRTRVGASLTVADGAGGWRRATYAGDTNVIATGPIEHEPTPHPLITIAFALTKGDKPELVVQKLTELGADHIVAFVAARSVVRWDDEKRQRNLDRWRVVAREAAMQCRRARMPEIEPVATFGEIAGRAGATRAAIDGAPVSLERPFVLIGPEGGWAPEEEAALPVTVALGDHVLRAETAAIAACSVLGALRSRVART